MPEPADHPPSRRERLAEALRKAAYVCPGDGCPHDENTCGVGEPIVLAAATYIDGEPEGTLIDGEVTAIADAVMPVVEAETAALRQRIEEVEDQRDQALAWQDTAERRLDHTERIADALEAERDQSRRERDEQTQRAEEAERERDVALAAADPFKIDRVKSLTAAMTRLVTTERDAARKRAEEAEARNRQYETAIAAERKGRLAAEAAVRRARELARNRIAVPSDVLREALTIEQPEEP